MTALLKTDLGATPLLGRGKVRDLGGEALSAADAAANVFGLGRAATHEAAPRANGSFCGSPHSTSPLGNLTDAAPRRKKLFGPCG